MTHPKAVLGALTLAAALLFAPAARAADLCRPDKQRFCQGIPRGGGRILACLKSHEAELSPACVAQLTAAREQVRAFRKACHPDARRLCQGIPAGKGRIWACLKSHEADLSPACRAEMGR